MEVDCHTIRLPLHRWALDKHIFHRGSQHIAECRPPSSELRVPGLCRQRTLRAGNFEKSFVHAMLRATPSDNQRMIVYVIVYMSCIYIYIYIYIYTYTHVYVLQYGYDRFDAYKCERYYVMITSDAVGAGGSRI